MWMNFKHEAKTKKGRKEKYKVIVADFNIPLNK